MNAEATKKHNPAIMPQGMAARLAGVKRQDIARWISTGRIEPYITHGEKWVSIADVMLIKANPPRKGRPRKIN